MTAASTRAEEDESATARVGTAARGTALNLAGSVVGAAVGFVTIGLVTNHWGRSDAGLFFAATALFTLGANGARMGSEAGLTYFVARLRADGRDGSVPTVIRTALRLTAGVALVVAVIGVVAAPALSRLVTSEASSRADATAMIRILAVAVPTFSLTQALSGVSRGFATMRPAVVSGQLVRPLSQLALVVAVVLTTDSLPALALAWALSSAVTLVTIGAWVRRRVARVRERHGRETDPTVAVRYLRFSIGRAGADLVSAALERLDVIVVAAVLGQSAAGLYGASGRLILAGQLLMIAASQSTAPQLTASFAAGRDDEAGHLLRTVTAWNVTLLWPLFICLGFGATTALSIFGPEFTDGQPVVVVLALTMLVIVGLGGGDTVLTSTGDSVRSLVNHVAALVVMVGSALILLPRIGLTGAAVSWALSRLTLRGLASVRVWRTRRVHAMGRPVVLAGAAAVVAYGPLGLAATSILGPGPVAVAVNVVGGAAIHVALLARLRHELELDRFIATLTRRTVPIR
jgi:O-antigen/teichoic acid export membrane protein